MHLRILSIIVFLPLFCLAQKDYKYSTKSKSAIKSFEKAASAYDYKKYEEALTFLNDAIKEDDNFIEAHMMMGDVYADTKDFANSVVHYRRAIEIDPGFFPQNFFNLAKSEMRIEKYEDAKTHLDKFLSFSKISPALKMKADRMMAGHRRTIR